MQYKHDKSAESTDPDGDANNDDSNLCSDDDFEIIS